MQVKLKLLYISANNERRGEESGVLQVILDCAVSGYHLVLKVLYYNEHCNKININFIYSGTNDYGDVERS